MSKSTYGFTLVEGLLITLIVCVVGFAGYYVMSNKNDSSKTTDSTSSAKDSSTKNSDVAETKPAVATKKFTNKDFGVSVDLPETWTTKDESELDGGKPFIFVVTVSDGKEEATLQTVTGKGGDCQVKPTDKPFAAGNGCPTQEFTKVTKTNDGGYLSRSSLSDSEGKKAYWLCYTPKTQTAPVANNPQMGFYLNCGPNDIFIKIPNNASATAYDSTFVKELENSLKTLSFAGLN